MKAMVSTILLVLTCLILYFLPTLIARVGGSKRVLVYFLVNLFFTPLGALFLFAEKRLWASEEKWLRDRGLLRP